MVLKVILRFFKKMYILFLVIMNIYYLLKFLLNFLIIIVVCVIKTKYYQGLRFKKFLKKCIYIYILNIKFKIYLKFVNLLYIKKLLKLIF